MHFGNVSSINKLNYQNNFIGGTPVSTIERQRATHVRLFRRASKTTSAICCPSARTKQPVCSRSVLPSGACSTAGGTVPRSHGWRNVLSVPSVLRYLGCLLFGCFVLRTGGMWSWIMFCYVAITEDVGWWLLLWNEYILV